MNIHSRGGYYKNWQETTGGAEATSRLPGAVAGDGRPAGADGDEQIKDEDSSNDEAEPLTAEQDEDDEGNMIDPALRSKGKGPMREDVDLTTTQAPTREPSAAPPAAGEEPPRNDGNEIRDDIQILELHSDHPLISYRGRLFEGEWAEIIGTEALLARHDDKKPLPALRQVPGGIDMLGAVSSRIVTKEKVAKARQQDQDPLAAARAEWNIHIPPGKDRRGERRQQARFLENLIALKKMKGQTDNVTVYAQDGAGKDFDDTKDPDYKPRRKRALNVLTGGTATPEASGSGRSRPSGRGGRGRTRGPGRGRRATTGPRGGSRQSTVVSSQPQSTPTPARWEDLEAMDEDEGGDEDDDVDMD